MASTPANKRPRTESYSRDCGRGGGSTDLLSQTPGGTQTMDLGSEPKARKACINCRRQKMKCVSGNGTGDTCRRCHRAGIPCIFVPRANAASLPTPVLQLASISGTPSTVIDAHFKTNVLRRLATLEDCLGLAHNFANDKPGTSGAEPSHYPGEHDPVHAAMDAESPDSATDSGSEDASDGYPLAPEFASLHALWSAVGMLRRSTPSSVPRRIWRPQTIAHLWSVFHERMPGLHFMPRKQTFSAPQPLLLAAMLYCSSKRGAPGTAENLMAEHYFTVLCNAVAMLSVPDSEISQPPPGDAEEWAFQTVLGLVLAGLLTEASKRVTGVWISIAYRLMLEHCPAGHQVVDGTAAGRGREWRKLFSGVQIVDLEHASLHLSCPVIPIESPLPALRVGHRDQLYRLSRMMHTGLTHFTGRGLPTIWECFTQTPRDVSGANGVAMAGGGAAGSTCSSATFFTPVDAAVIRDWARQLDEWLVEFGNTVEGSEHDRKPVLRQYVLHRLVVLSIYHPARGCDLWSNSISPREQRELLLSARATLKLHLHDDSIWSNWDLVMITWAALIVIQGLEGGVGEADDLNNIRIHLDMLKQINEPKPSLCEKLIARLEDSLRGVNTPDSNAILQQQQLEQEHQQHGAQAYFDPNTATPGLDPYSWQIFDQASLQQVYAYPMTWPTAPGDPSVEQSQVPQM